MVGGMIKVSSLSRVLKSFSTFTSKSCNLRAGTRYYSGSNYGHRYKRFDSSYGRTNSNLFNYLVYDPNGRRYTIYALGGGLVFYIANLEKAPITGRTRFLWVPKSLELAVGNYSYSSMLSDTKAHLLPKNHPKTLQVSKVFHKIVDAARRDPEVDSRMLEGVEWQIHVINDPRAPPNAFVLPGGKVFIFSSMMGICQDDDGIAAVLSHEFAHQLARHTAENLSKAPIYAILGLLLYSFTGIDGINRILVDTLLKMPASRQMETEADYIGLMIMSRACYQPQSAVHLWKRMREFERRTQSGTNFEFMSTHPASERRIQNMTDWLPKATQIYDASDCGVLRDSFSRFNRSMFSSSAGLI